MLLHSCLVALSPLARALLSTLSRVLREAGRGTWQVWQEAHREPSECLAEKLDAFLEPACVAVHSWEDAGPRYDDFVASPADPRTITFIAPETVSVQLIDYNSVRGS